MADVSISYKNTEIATMNATGVKTLLTGDCFCEDDIVVSYTKPSASLQSKTVSPTTSQQTVSSDNGYDGLSSVTVNAMPSGSATTPATTITANPTISVSSGGLITASVSGSQSVTPTVSAGYVSSGTAGTITVSGSNTSQLTAQAAQTIHPSATDQTIASGKYLTGAQTLKGVLLTNLSSANIKKDVVVKVGDSTDDDCVTSVTGTYEGGGGTAKTVAISLSAPSAPKRFGSFTIFECDLTNFAEGQQIGSISSPNGSTTVTVSAEVNGIMCELRGENVTTPSRPFCIGGVGFNSYNDGSNAWMSFSVSASGSIDIAGISWNS